jgi:hypothetical protein
VPVDGWVVPGALHCDVDAVKANREVFKAARANWQAAYGPPITASDLPQFLKEAAKSDVPVIEAVPLATVLEDLLLKVQVRDLVDAEDHSAMLITLASLMAKQPDLVVDVFLMTETYRSRTAGRGFAANEAGAPIGEYFSNTAGSVNDKSHMSPERISLQLRDLSVGFVKRDRTKADIKDVPWYALNVPRALRKSLIIEERK